MQVLLRQWNTASPKELGLRLTWDTKAEIRVFIMVPQHPSSSGWHSLLQPWLHHTCLSHIQMLHNSHCFVFFPSGDCLKHLRSLWHCCGVRIRWETLSVSPKEPSVPTLMTVPGSVVLFKCEGNKQRNNRRSNTLIVLTLPLFWTLSVDVFGYDFFLANLYILCRNILN